MDKKEELRDELAPKVKAVTEESDHKETNMREIIPGTLVIDDATG